MTQCRCRVMLAMMLSRQLGCDTMSLSSHTGNDAAEATWLRRDVSIESC
jgi:hypothetical protein